MTSVAGPSERLPPARDLDPSGTSVLGRVRLVASGTIEIVRKRASSAIAIVALAAAFSCGGEAARPDARLTGDATSDGLLGLDAAAKADAPATGSDASDATEGIDVPVASDTAEPYSGVSPDGGAEPDGAAAPPNPACPGTPPAAGTACRQSDDCFYEDCVQYGQAQARCVGGIWDVTTAVCAGTPCRSDSGNFDRSCVAGQICVRRKGAIVVPECDENPCAGQVSELKSCLQTKYVGCDVVAWLGTGATVDCADGSCSSSTCQ